MNIKHIILDILKHPTSHKTIILSWAQMLWMVFAFWTQIFNTRLLWVEAFWEMMLIISIINFTYVFFEFWFFSAWARLLATIKKNKEWNWTIIRVPTLHDKPLRGYQFCKVSDISIKHSLSREDYASCLLDSIENSNHFKRIFTIISK